MFNTKCDVNVIIPIRHSLMHLSYGVGHIMDQEVAVGWGLI